MTMTPYQEAFLAEVDRQMAAGTELSTESVARAVLSGVASGAVSEEVLGSLPPSAERYVIRSTGAVAMPGFVPPEFSALPMPGAGADLRDMVPSQGWDAELGVSTSLGGLTSLSTIIGVIGRLAKPVRDAIIAAIRRVARAGRARWDDLPGWVRQILVVLGITAGTDIVIDQFTPEAPVLPGGAGMLPGMPGGGGIVGSWTANGVIFYRLSDGRLAVQNKLGRWKVWKPKRPIVLFADGARNIKTALRADRALNRQAKSIAGMLARRNQPRKSRAKAAVAPAAQIIAIDGTRVR